MREAEKKFSNAHVLLSKAEEALYDNQDPSEVSDLIQAVRDAQDNVNTRQNNLTRAEELTNLLQEDYDGIWEARDKALADILAAEVADAKKRLGELKGVFDDADTAKKEYDTEETRLRGLKTEADAGDDEKAKTDAAQAL